MPDPWSQEQTLRAISQYHLEGPVLDVGSGEFSDWFRPMFAEAGLEYTALDMQAREGVDIVADVTEYANHAAMPRYGAVLCLSVAEHAERPDRVVDSCVALLRPGGHLLFAAPICWEHHSYPQDYWRILPDGVRLMLKGMKTLELIDERGDMSHVERNQLFCVARRP